MDDVQPPMSLPIDRQGAQTILLRSDLLPYSETDGTDEAAAVTKET